MDKIKSFEELKISGKYIEKLKTAGIEEPTLVQAQAIPMILEGKSVLFQSETGTGKTLAYLLPLFERIEKEENERREVKIVIVAPTVELASQIKTQVKMITDAKAALLVGGAPIKRQIELLKEKPLVVIGGPARLLELFHLKKLKLDNAEAVVLDEVDRLTSKEIADETLSLVNAMKKDIQLVAASATITKSTQKILQDTRIKQNGTAESKIETLFLPPEDVLRKRITHLAVFAETREKIDTLRKILAAEKAEKTLVFTSRADQVLNIVSKLRYKHVDCFGLTAKTEKTERKSTIDRFRSGKIKILVTSDLASRGLDIPGITHVVQMDFPGEEDFFVHRAGRTARAGKSGVNIVIGDAYEMRKYAALEKKLKIVVYPRMLYKGNLVDPNEVMEKSELFENKDEEKNSLSRS